MIVLGLTGSIGMGKSTTLAMFEYMGAAVFDSDAAVHNLLGPNGAAIHDVGRAFPGTANRKKMCIDRSKLGEIVFGDPHKRELLESILHPYVWWEQDKFLKARQRLGVDLAVLDIPLLFETGAQTRVDYTICVTAPLFLQHLRVMRRPGMDAQRLNAILQTQMADIDKRKMADFVVHTGLGRARAMREVRKLLREIKASANCPGSSAHPET